MKQSAAEDDAKTQILQAWRESLEEPGKYLIQLRELQQKTIKEMSAELGLSVEQISALENDDKNKLPAPIYIKNYIKRYCLILGVTEEDISSVMEEISKDVLPTLGRVSIRHQVNVRQIIMRYLAYAVIASLVVLLLYGLKSMDLSGLWGVFSSTTAPVESTAAELSLPMVTDEDAP